VAHRTLRTYKELHPPLASLRQTFLIKVLLKGEGGTSTGITKSFQARRQMPVHELRDLAYAAYGKLSTKAASQYAADQMVLKVHDPP
jgi:hypothetical protein